MDTPVSPTGFEIEFDIYKNRRDAPEFTLGGSSASARHKSVKGKAKKAAGGGLKVKQVAVSVLVLLALTTVFGMLAPVLSPANPALAAMYRGFGVNVPVPGQGLGLDRLQLKTVWEGNSNKIEITTRILNLTETTLKIPPILVEAMDEEGKPTGKAWTLTPPTATLPAQGSVPFTVRLPDMPDTKSETLSLRASFAS